MRLNQSPCHTRLGTKVAVDRERIVTVPHNFVNAFDVYIFILHDVFTRPKHELTLVSAESGRTCAVESSLCDVTHFMARSSVFAGAELTALVMTVVIGAGCTRKSLEKIISD